MASTEKTPTARGEIILQRLEERALSIAEVTRRTPLTKNTVLNAIYGPRDPQRKTIEILADVLELPVEELTRPGDEEPSAKPPERPSFWRFLLRPGNPCLWVGLGGAVATAFLLQYEAPQTTAVQGVQAGVILFLLALLPRSGGPPEADPRTSHRWRLALAASHDLRRHWGIVWLLWFFLYLSLAVAAGLGFLPRDEPAEATRWALLWLNLLQNGATIELFRCYEIVARPTLRDDFSRRQVLPTEAWLALLVLLAGGELGCLLLAPDLQSWFGWVSGFGQGTALALLVGRFDSKYLDPPAIVIGLLYFYAAIQGAWPALRQHGELMMALTFTALVLKCLLFIFVSWLFASRVILYYLARMRELDEDVTRDREEFLTRRGEG